MFESQNAGMIVLTDALLYKVKEERKFAGYLSSIT